MSETIGCNFLFFGQYHSREREPCNVPSPYPPWHITNVMCRANTTPDTFHVQCANALRSVAHFTCNVRGLYPLGTLQVRASANFYWSTPDRAPVGRGGGPPQSNKIKFQFLRVYEFPIRRMNVRLFKLLFLVIIISEVLKLVPPDRMLPFAPSFYKDPRSAILEYANVDFHHLLATSGNQTLHFPKLREQENIHIKAQQHEAARQARLNKKLEKMTPVEDFSDCCTRYSTSCACRIFTLLFLIQLTLEAQKVLVLLLWSGNA